MYYTHECRAPKHLRSQSEISFIPTTTMIRKIQRWFRSKCLVWPEHPSCQLYFRSQAAITYEQKRHIESGYWYIIHPLSKFRTTWELIMTIFTIIFLFLIPVVIGLKKGSVGMSCTNFEIVCYCFDILCFFDVIINLLTGYCNPGMKQIILKPSKTTWNYLTGLFIVDFLVSLPNINNTYMGYIKVLRLHTLIKYLRNMGHSMVIHELLMKLATLALVTMYYFHWSSLILYSISLHLLNTEHNLTWIHEAGLDKANISDSHRYVYTLYKTSCHIFGMHFVRYNNLHTYDVVATIIFMILGRFFSIYVIVTMLKTILSWLGSQTKYEEIINQLKEYMRHKKLPLTTQSRLIDYYEYRFQNNYFRENSITGILSHTDNSEISQESFHNNNATENHRGIKFGIIILCQSLIVQFIAAGAIHIRKYVKYNGALVPEMYLLRLTLLFFLRFLLERLREEITLFCCRRLVENVIIFKKLPKIVLGEIMTSLQEEMYMPNDIIIKADAIGDCMFFLVRGTVAVYTRNGKEICHLQDSAYFGEISLLLKDERRIASVIAIEICQVYRLKKKHFKRCFKANPDLYRVMQKNALERIYKTNRIQDMQKKSLIKKSTSYKKLLIK